MLNGIYSACSGQSAAETNAHCAYTPEYEEAGEWVSDNDGCLACAWAHFSGVFENNPCGGSVEDAHVDCAYYDDFMELVNKTLGVAYAAALGPEAAEDAPLIDLTAPDLPPVPWPFSAHTGCLACAWMKVTGGEPAPCGFKHNTDG